MNKVELIENLAEAMEITKVKATKMVNYMFDSMETAMTQGRIVDIAGFSKFDLVETKERKGHNPKTMAPITIAAKTAIRFKPSKSLKEKVNAPRNV